MENSNSYKYCYYDSQNSILYHDVSDENFGNKESFVFSMSFFSTMIDKYRPKGLIIKVYKKPDFFELNLASFRESTIVKVVKDVQVKKIAFFLTLTDFIDDLRKQEINAPFMVRFFFDLEEARKWVIGGE